MFPHLLVLCVFSDNLKLGDPTQSQPELPKLEQKKKKVKKPTGQEFKAKPGSKASVPKPWKQQQQGDAKSATTKPKAKAKTKANATPTANVTSNTVNTGTAATTSRVETSASS